MDTAAPDRNQDGARPRLGVYGRAGAGLVLAWVAGCVDAVGYLVLAQVFTSHVTGNTSNLGMQLDRRHLAEAARHAWPIATFVVGLMAGATITEIGRRRRIHSRMSLVLGVEILLMAGLMAAGTTRVENSTWWLALPALAMGMQTVTITRIGSQRIYSTFMTGTLAKFAEALTGYGFWLADRRPEWREAAWNPRRWMREAVRERLLWHALLNGSLWLLFFLGAWSGAALELNRGVGALAWPMAVLACLAGVDLIRPIAAVEVNEPSGFEN